MKAPFNIRLMRPAVVASVLAVTIPATVLGQLGGTPGAYSRLGFGARGAGMGNAMSAVITGDIVGYYNPALLPWTAQRQVSASYGILSLDRTLNFLSFSTALPRSAGISLGVINAGVSNIDGRDGDGNPTGPLKTSEDALSLGFGNRFPGGFALGVNIKLLYYHLYTDISSTTVGIDAGALVPVGDHLTISATVRDIGSKYKWDTSVLYGQQGKTSEDQFPVLYTLGVSYLLPDTLALIAGEFEMSDQKTLIARIGVEVPLVRNIAVRGGIDRIDLKNQGNGIRPSLGFSAGKDLDGWTPAVNYAYVIEPFSPKGMHLVSVSVRF
jgi:hypothetical protein